MEACYACGASLSEDAQWCSQCYAPRGRAASTAGPVASLTRPMPAKATLPPQVVKTRWRKTQTTFGPVGRVLCTLGLVVVCIVLVVAAILTGGLGVFGACLWTFVVMPWALRDVWRAGQLPVS